MRKLLTILLTVLTAALVLVGCSMETKVEDGLALLAFRVSEQGLTSKSLTRTNPVLNETDFYWYYTAEKLDDIGLESGETLTQVAIKDGEKGIQGKAIGPFSYGLWKFTLYGYANYDQSSKNPQNLVYEGSSTLTVNKKSNTLEVTVSSKSSGAEGTLEFPALGAIAITGKKVTFDHTKFVEKIYIKGLDTSNESVEKTLYNSSERKISLASGNYSVDISYLSGATQDNDSYTGGMTVAEDTIYVTIADYLTTKIAGDIQENTGSVVVEVSSGVYSATSNVVELKEEETTLEIPVNVAPVKKASKEGSDTGTEAGDTQQDQEAEAEVKTTVTVPKELVAGNVSKASVSITSYSQEAAASTMPTYTVEGTTPTSLNTLVPLGGLDIDLYVNDSEEKTTDFAENQTLTISTVIASGLNGGVDYDKSTADENTKCAIIVKYNGTGGKDGQVVKYNAKTGEITFTVSHLSTYFFVDTDAKIYNQTSNATYKDLDSAISAATEGDTILLLDCSLSNDVPDAHVSRFNWQVVHNNCSAEDEGFLHAKNTDFYGGYGTKLEPYLISNKEQFKPLNSSNQKYGYYKWYEKDGTLDASNWEPDNIYLCGSFDGDGLTINNLDHFLFRAVWNGSSSWAPSNDVKNTYTIKNLTINANIVSSGSAATVARTIGVHNFVMENVTVHGYIEGSTHVASYVCYGAGQYDSSYVYDSNITFKNCHSDATIAARYGNAVGFIAHPSMSTAAGKISLINSDFKGTMIAVNKKSFKYVSGNWTNATISNDKDTEENTILYDKTENGWLYKNEGKVINPVEDKEIKDLSIAKGQVISIGAVDKACTALVELVITPGPYSFTGTYFSEKISISDNKFISNQIKYFTVRINSQGITEQGISGEYFDVVYQYYDGKLNADTLIIFTQYDTEGNILKITNISLGDKTTN